MTISAGALYSHRKSGGTYRVISLAKIEADGTEVVVYRSTETGETWVRPVDEFTESVFVPDHGYGPRFEKVKPHVNDLTPEWVQAEMVAKGDRRYPNRSCSICGEFTHWIVQGDHLYFDSSCGCAYSDPQPRSWADVVEFIQMQTMPENALRVAAIFDLDVEA